MIFSRCFGKVNDNAYKLDLIRDIGVSLLQCGRFHTLSRGDDDLRANLNQEGDDEARAMLIPKQEEARVILSATKA